MHSLNLRLIGFLFLMALTRSGAAENSKPDLKPLLYVAESVDAATSAYKNPTEEVSILDSHYLVILLPNPKIGHTYQFKYSVKDDDDKEVASGTMSFRASMAPQFMWQPVVPDYKKCKSGKWSAVVSEASVGKLSVDYTVLPQTPSQQEDLASYEQAREGVIRAFAEYWLGVTNHFGADPNEAFYYTSIQVLKNQQDPVDKLLDAASISTNTVLLGIGGVDYAAEKGGVSAADRLNGITYQGTARFTFTVMRDFHDGKWSPWFDVREEGNSMWKGLADLFSNPSTPDFMKKGYGVYYTVQEKDGHWRIENDGGVLFVNGKRLDPNSQMHLVRPSLAQTSLIIGQGADPRRLDKKVGDEVKASPQPLPVEVRKTMELLRGGPL